MLYLLLILLQHHRCTVKHRQQSIYAIKTLQVASLTRNCFKDCLEGVGRWLTGKTGLGFNFSDRLPGQSILRKQKIFVSRL